MTSGVSNTLSVVGRILDQFVERRALDHLARGRRKVAAELRTPFRSAVSCPFRMSASMCCRPLSRFSPLVSSVFSSTSGLVSGKVGRAHRVDEALGREAQLLLLQLIDALGQVDRLQHLLRDKQIALPDQVEHWVRRHSGAAKRRSLGCASGASTCSPGVRKRCHSLMLSDQKSTAALGYRSRLHQSRESRRCRCAVCLHRHVDAVFQHELLGATDHRGPALHVFESRAAGGVSVRVAMTLLSLSTDSLQLRVLRETHFVMLARQSRPYHLARMAKRNTCPICGKLPELQYKSRFCSRGCKDRDVLNWLGDGYRVPGPPADDERRTGQRREPCYRPRLAARGAASPGSSVGRACD